MRMSGGHFSLYDPLLKYIGGGGLDGIRKSPLLSPTNIRKNKKSTIFTKE